MFKDVKVEEIIVYLMLIIIGYCIAKMFNRNYNGFNVGGVKCHVLNTVREMKDIDCESLGKTLNQSNRDSSPVPGTFTEFCCQ